MESSTLNATAKAQKAEGGTALTRKGVHFIGLVNAAAVDGLGRLGSEQLSWLEDDVRQKSGSTPIVVFAHIPLWAAYPEWGWGTDDSAQALSLLKRFGSLTVLNGHVHQVLQKVEGNVTFHTGIHRVSPTEARDGTRTRAHEGASGSPSKRPWDCEGRFVSRNQTLAVVDSSLDEALS